MQRKDALVFVIEFKVGEASFSRAAIDQVWDYALDLRNFHETSHGIPIAPMLVATQAKPVILGVVLRADDALMPEPVCAGATQIRAAITHILELLACTRLDPYAWERGRYRPTPTSSSLLAADTLSTPISVKSMIFRARSTGWAMANRSNR